MFSAKQKQLFDVKSKKTQASVTNQFLAQGMKAANKTLSGNGSLKYKSSGNEFLNQFANISDYRQLRSFEAISKDMSLLYSLDKEAAIALTVYIRLVTRQVKFFNGEKTTQVQKGQGLKHEAILRMLWLAVKDEDAFWNNLEVFISAGSWKDIIQMLSYDLQYHGWDNKILNWNKFAGVIQAGLENPETTDLVKKYLPQIKCKTHCKTLEAQADTMIAKFISNKLFGEKQYKQYRLLKTSGKAHEWQKLISKKLLNQINFGSVHGRALAKLVSGKFLENNKLTDKYEAWIATQPVAKYTGYVYELMQPVKSGYKNLNLKKYQVDTINKQFYGLIENAKKNVNTETKFIVALDTSSSMTSAVKGLKVSSYDVGKSIALFFSYLLEGEFKDYFFEFADRGCLKKWQGSTPVERLQNDRSEAYGNTNFLGIADEYAKLLNKGVPECQFPNGLIAISDGEFDRGSSGNKTNVEQFKNKLIKNGFSKRFVDNFKFVFWDIRNGYYDSNSKAKFESYGEHTGIFYMSGLDASGLSFLFGKTENGKAVAIPKSAEELMEAALTQEIMQKIVV